MEVIIIPFTDKVMQDRKNIANESMCVLSYMMYIILMYMHVSTHTDTHMSCTESYPHTHHYIHTVTPTHKSS